VVREEATMVSRKRKKAGRPKKQTKRARSVSKARAPRKPKRTSRRPAPRKALSAKARKKVSTKKAGPAAKKSGVPIKALGGHVVRIVLDADCEGQEHEADIHRAITSFVSLKPAALAEAEEHIFRYYLDCKDYYEPGEPGHVDIPGAGDVWKHIQFGGEATVSRRSKDNTVYISLGCNCDWEPEHGLQIVLKDGMRVTKVGDYDGHVTNADAYDDASLENVIYRPRRSIT
jgi:hypothetical protein